MCLYICSVFVSVFVCGFCGHGVGYFGAVYINLCSVCICSVYVFVCGLFVYVHVRNWIPELQGRFFF